MAEELGLFEAMYSQRALRYIKPDPIPDELVRKVLDAGIHAPNGGNSQRWNFLVIKDTGTKRWIGERYGGPLFRSIHSPKAALRPGRWHGTMRRPYIYRSTCMRCPSSSWPACNTTARQGI